MILPYSPKTQIIYVTLSAVKRSDIISIKKKFIALTNPNYNPAND